jgi:hypothetical protein
MAVYRCARCGQRDESGWTFYWFFTLHGKPAFCSVCEPIQRCHWHNEARQELLQELRDVMQARIHAHKENASLAIPLA